MRIVSLLVLGLCACGGSTQPTTPVLSGSFALDSIGSSLLPVLTFDAAGVQIFTTQLNVTINSQARTYAATERDSAVFSSPSLSPEVNSSHSVGVVSIGAAGNLGADSVQLSNFDGGAGRIIDANHFTLAHQRGVMFFRKTAP